MKNEHKLNFLVIIPVQNVILLHMYLAEVGENMRLSSHFLNREEKRNHITPTQIDNAEIKPFTL